MVRWRILTRILESKEWLKSDNLAVRAFDICFVFAWKRRLVFNKLTPVFHVCPIIDHEFRHNMVKAAVGPQTTPTMYDAIHYPWQ